MHPLLPNNIMSKVKATDLGYLVFRGKNQNGIMKGCGCAEDRAQQVYKSKEETSSPTACIESVCITVATKSHKGRDVAVIDIRGTFLQIKASDGIIIKLQGTVVESLLRMKPT